MQKLRDKINSYHNISDEDSDFLLSFYKKKEIPKGEYLFKAGQYVNQWFYIEKGCVCYYMLKDGKQKVIEFFMDDEFVTDLYSFAREKPTVSYLVAMEDTTICSVDRESVQKIFDHSHDLERFGRLSMQDTVLKTFSRVSHLNTMTNEKRYLRLLNKRPALFQKVPQYLIASYLGVTPVGLSKIRKRLSGNQ